MDGVRLFVFIHKMDTGCPLCEQEHWVSLDYAVVENIMKTEAVHNSIVTKKDKGNFKLC